MQHIQQKNQSSRQISEVAFHLYQESLQLNFSAYDIYEFYSYKMESSDGFRRRAAITITPHNRSLFSRQLDNVQETVQKLNHSNYIKFNKINESKHAILKSRKKQQEFHKIIEEIEHRKCTFYRMGFKSYEKQGQRKVFAEVLGLGSNQMKGTMYVGQLWANHEVGKFMKENKINMSKLKLMDKLQLIKKQYDQAQKTDSESDIAAGSCRSINTAHNIPGQLSFDRNPHYASMNKLKMNENLEGIRGQLKQLKRKAGKQSMINQMRYLERCKEKLENVERRYFLKMIQLQ